VEVEEGCEAEGEEAEVMSVAIFYGSCIESAVDDDGVQQSMLPTFVLRVFGVYIDGLTCRVRRAKP
jgi:hypothetical protein